MRLTVPLEEADRKHDAKLPCQRSKPGKERMAHHWIGGGKEPFLLHLTPIQILEEFRQQDETGSASGRVSHELDGMFDVPRGIGRHGHLNDADGHGACGHASTSVPAGCCWVTQWNAPPPVIRPRAGDPTTVRPGNSGRRISSARVSRTSPYTGTTTPPLAM